MTTIYLLVVKQPPTKEEGCRACQFRSKYLCEVEYREIYKEEVPDWCPLQKVEVKE